MTTPAETKHSALPWAVATDPKSPYWRALSTIFSEPEGKRVADTCAIFDEAEANAAYIVQACNAFPKLVEALDDAPIASKYSGGADIERFFADYETWKSSVRALLAQIKGE